MIFHCFQTVFYRSCFYFQISPPNIYVFFSLVLPYITPFTVEDEINSGDIIQLNCLVSKGDRPIKISWLLDEEPLKEDLGVSKTQIGDRTSLLMISPVLGSHAGNYTCMASNAAGSVNHTVTVRVNGIFLVQHVC